MAQVKDGTGIFGPALMAITSGTEESVEKLYYTINQELLKNMVDEDGDVDLGHRLRVLESFIMEVNDCPPDRLRGLWNQVKTYVQQKQPEMQRRAQQVEQQLQTAIKEEDLQSLATAMVELENFPGYIDKQDLQNSLRSFWDVCLKGTLQEVQIDVKDVWKPRHHTRLPVRLDLNINRLRRWLRQVQGLSPEEQRLLLDTLQPGLQDFEAWIAEALSDAVRSRLDPVELQRLLDYRSFQEFRQLCQLGLLLHASFGTARPSLQQAEDIAANAMKGAEIALAKVPDLREFNRHYGLLKAMNRCLADVVSTADYISILSQKVETRILNPLRKDLHNDPSSRCPWTAIMSLRAVATQAPELYWEIYEILDTELRLLMGRLSFLLIREVCERLSVSTEGQLVLQEHAAIFQEVFTGYSWQRGDFRRAAGASMHADVMDKLARNSGLECEEYHKLCSCMHAYERQLRELHRPHRLLETEKVREGVRQAADQCASQNPESALVLLTHLSLAFTVVTSEREVLESRQWEMMDYMVRPHVSQILSLLRLLQIHGAPPAATRLRPRTQQPLWQMLISGGGAGASENHLVEVPTGEGKCLILGLLAAFLALKGIPSDIVCHRKVLAEQDRAAMTHFYEFLGIEDQVHYTTFDELCQEHLEGPKTSAKELMDLQTPPKDSSRCDLSTRVLLIDEVDVLFRRSFSGGTRKGGLEADGAEAEKLRGIDLLFHYKCVLGVTGTLQALRDVEQIQHILSSEYFFKHYTIVPSIFGASNLTFRWGEDVDIMDTEEDWVERISHVLLQHAHHKYAILVFFKNEKSLEKMLNFQELVPEATVTEGTPATRLKGYIASATTEGRATFFTRAFGRGIDFHAPSSQQVVVLQTFLSSFSSEQTQIKGRAARHGKPGRYHMVLCAKHLEAKFGITPEEIATLKHADGEQLRIFLEEKQKEKMGSKAAKLCVEVEDLARPLLLQVSVEGAELTFHTMGGEVAATVTWPDENPVQELPFAVLEAIRSSGFQTPSPHLRASNLRLVLPQGALLDVSPRAVSLAEQLAR